MELTLDDETSNKRKISFHIDNPDKSCYNPAKVQRDEYSDLFNEYDVRRVRSAANTAGVGLNDDSLIHSLHVLLYEASGHDHILQPNELREYVKIEQNKLRMRPFASLISAIYYPSLDAKRINESEINEVYGFFKYLRDFTLMPERHIHEVSLWQEFMVFAALFHLTDQVGADLRRINPDLASLDDLTKRYLARPMQDAVSSLATALDYTVSVTHSYYTPAERSRFSSSSRTSSSRSYDSGSNYERSSGRGGSSSYSGGGGHRGGGGSGVR